MTKQDIKRGDAHVESGTDPSVEGPIQGDKEEGRAYLKRLAELGSTVGLAVAAVILLGRYRLPFLFTNEPVVGHTVAQILPIIGFLMVCSRNWSRRACSFSM